MGKRIIYMIICLCIFLGNTLTARAEVESPRIEQVYLNMPDITVYSYGIGQNQNVEGFLDGKKLSLDSKVDFKSTGEGIQYYILLDISGSIPKDYFNKMKESIVNFHSTLSPNDGFSLITFGETVQTKVDSKVSNNELKSTLESISNRDQDTLLFEAIKTAVEKNSQDHSSQLHRKEIIVLSDGEDRKDYLIRSIEPVTKGVNFSLCFMYKRYTKREY